MIPSILPTYNRAPLSFSRGEGVWMDSDDGRRFLDLGAGIAVNVLGHAHPALVETLTELCADPDAPTTVLVTHHVEEIPVGITHVLMLAAGKVVAAGPIAETMNSQNLTATFGLPLQIDSIEGRWSARAARPQPAPEADSPNQA